MEFSRKECWGGLPFLSPGDCPNPGIEPGSPVLQADSLQSEPPDKPSLSIIPSKSIHVVANDKILFFFMAEEYSCVCVCVSFLFNHPLIGI